MRSFCLCLVLILAGCVSPGEREVRDVRHRLKIAEGWASIQKVAIEACDERQRHVRICTGKCKYSAVRHSRCRAVARKKRPVPRGIRLIRQLIELRRRKKNR